MKGDWQPNPAMCVAITIAPSACHIYTNLKSAPHFCGNRLIIYLFDFWLAVLRWAQSKSPPRSSTVPIAVSQLNSVSISKCFICAVCLAHSIYIKSNQKPCTLTGSVSSNFQHVFAYAYVPPSSCTYPTVQRTLHPQYSPKSILNNSTVCLSHQLATLYAILFDFPLSPCFACDEAKQSRQVMPGQYYVLSNMFTLLSQFLSYISVFIFNINKLYFAYLSFNWIFKYLSEKTCKFFSNNLNCNGPIKKYIEIYL